MKAPRHASRGLWKTLTDADTFCMTGTVDQARNRVRVHKHHTTKGKSHTEERKEANDVVDDEVGSDMERYVMSVVKALTLEDGEVLIGIAWTTK